MDKTINFIYAYTFSSTEWAGFKKLSFRKFLKIFVEITYVNNVYTYMSRNLIYIQYL